jgi:2-oxoglutarate dehydrogenase E1 component
VNTDAVDVCRLLKDYPNTVDLSVFGLEKIDFEKRFDLSSEFLAQDKKWWTVMEVVDFMTESYCGSIGVEYTHLSDRYQRSWIKTIFERGAIEAGVGGDRPSTQRSAAPGHKRTKRPLGGKVTELSVAEQKEALEMLVRADHLERFLGNKFPAVKRFGIEGAEAVVPGLHAMICRAAQLGMEGVELGMAHRGRLNVLVNLFGKPLGAICNEFTESDMSVGDVKYHLGTYAKRQVGSSTVYMNLAANPSHLEVSPPLSL